MLRFTAPPILRWSGHTGISAELNDSNQIFASKYMLYLPTEQELKKEIERQRVQIEQERKLNQ